MCSKADVSGSLMYGTAPKLKKRKTKIKTKTEKLEETMWVIGLLYV